LHVSLAHIGYNIIRLAFKVFITIIWLSVPLAAYHFASRNYDLYLQAEAQQIHMLDAMESYLRVHTDALADKSREISSIRVPSDRQAWRAEWQALLDARNRERARLPVGQATHYPLTQQRLQELDAQLDDLQKQAERADNYRFDSLKLRSSIEQLVTQIDAARANAWYYERIRAWGIHALLLEDITQMEQAYNNRWRDLRHAEQVSAAKLAEVERSSREIIRVLNDLEGLKQADTQEAYQSDLARHLQEFDLLIELRKLAAGEDSKASPGRSGIV
jgi:hypothetical protein